MPLYELKNNISKIVIFCVVIFCALKQLVGGRCLIKWLSTPCLNNRFFFMFHKKWNATGGTKINTPKGPHRSFNSLNNVPCDKEWTVE